MTLNSWRFQPCYSTWTRKIQFTTIAYPRTRFQQSRESPNCWDNHKQSAGKRHLRQFPAFRTVFSLRSLLVRENAMQIWAGWWRVWFLVTSEQGGMRQGVGPLGCRSLLPLSSWPPRVTHCKYLASFNTCAKMARVLAYERDSTLSSSMPFGAN